MARNLQLLTIFLFGSLAYAEEPVLVAHPNLAWWSNSGDTTALNASFDNSGNGGVEARWGRKWGLSSSVINSDATGGNSANDPDYVSVDIKRRLSTKPGNSFFALGLGWESISIGNGVDTGGPRLLLEGQAGLTPKLSLYGHTAWLPALDASTDFEDPEGFEFEAGLAVKALPQLSLRAGYREIRLDFKSLEGVNEIAKSKVVILGAGVHW